MGPLLNNYTLHIMPQQHDTSYTYSRVYLASEIIITGRVQECFTPAVSLLLQGATNIVFQECNVRAITSS